MLTAEAILLDQLGDADRQPMLQRYADNLQVLQQQHADLAERIKAIDDMPGMRIVPQGENHFQVFEARHGQFVLLTGTPQSQARSLGFNNPTPPATLLMGAGLGYELLEVYRQSKFRLPGEIDYQSEVYLVELSDQYFAVLMLLHDLRELLQDESVHLFVGTEACQQLHDWFASSLKIEIPANVIRISFHVQAAELDATISHILQQRKNALTQRENYLAEQIRMFYLLQGEEPRQQFRKGELQRSLRVLALTSRFTTYLQYSNRDLMWGFEQIGCEVQTHYETTLNWDLTRVSIAEAILDFEPDVVVTLDHFRGEFRVIPETLPFINWIQDLLPNIVDPQVPALGKHDHTFVFCDAWSEGLKKHDFYQDIDLPVVTLGVNTSIYYPVNGVNKDIPLSFVTHLNDPDKGFQYLLDERQYPWFEVEKEVLAEKRISKPDLLSFYRELALLIRETPLPDLMNFVKGKAYQSPVYALAFKRSGVEVSEELLKKLFDGYSRLFFDLQYNMKLRPVSYLARQGVDVHVYGRHWDDACALPGNAKGTVGNGAPLNEITNRSCICLNNSPGTSFHMRALEVLGSGAFMLTRIIRPPYDNMPIERYFDPETELVRFDTEQELYDKVSYYLGNVDEREAIAERGHQRVLNEYSYSSIARNMLNKAIAR
ncbi:MAG: glycosyltransferase [Chromatiales bacterium]|jgi:hypothetical protein